MIKPLRILMVSNNYKPYNGGLVSVLDTYHESLKKLGHEVILVTLDFGGDNSNDKEIIRIFCPIKFRFRKKYIAIPLNASSQIENIIKKFSPDVVHAHHPFLLGAAALKVAKKLNIPTIFTYHTIYEKYLHHIPLPRFITKLISEKLVKKFLSKVDFIIAPSQSAYEKLGDYGVQHKAEILGSGILPEFVNQNFEFKMVRDDPSTCVAHSFPAYDKSYGGHGRMIENCNHPVRGECFAQQNVSNHKFNLLTVSRFEKEKNITFLLDAFFQLDQSKYTFTLVGHGSQLNFLKKYAYEFLNLSSENIIFLENLEKDKIAQIYKNSDLFIFASETETQGLVLAESMAAGTPVIALDASGSRDILIPGYNGFLIKNKLEMVHKINQISSNFDLWNNLQQGAWETSKNYWPEACADKLSQIYFLQKSTKL